MSAKEQAVQDIKQELAKQGKCFFAFRKELNPVMRKLVSRQIKDQMNIGLSSSFHPKAQLMARCFFCKGEVIYENYTKYYAHK